MNILDKKIGELTDPDKRTTWKQEFSGISVRMWLLLLPRAILIIPLSILSNLLLDVGEFLDGVVSLIDQKIR